MTLTLPLDRVEVILVHVSGRGLPTQQIGSKLVKKAFCGQTNTREFQSIMSAMT